MSVRIIDPGAQSSVQDLGRPGYAHLGVPTGGAADPVSLVIGNRLVGNPDGAAGLEVALSHGVFAFETEAVIVVTGMFADAQLVSADGVVKTISRFELCRVQGGSTLTLRVTPAGMRAYVCIAGGVQTPKVLGSRSVYAPATLAKGLRVLGRGDVLTLGATGTERRHMGVNPLSRPGYLAAPPNEIRVIGAAGGVTNEIVSQSFTVLPQSNRSGIRLKGERQVASMTASMITEGMTCGAIQMTPDGTLIVLFVDGPTTGGYPVIGHVIAADLPRLGQLTPGARFRFECVDWQAAQRAAIRQSRELDRLLPPCATLVVDLNCDLGEGMPHEHDEALMRHATSVSIACGGHAGDEATMRRTIRGAIAHGCRIGAHPSYPDRENFGRETIAIGSVELERSLIEQISALRQIAEEEGARVEYVKPHGAMYNDAAHDGGVAEVIARAVRACDPSLAIMGFAGSLALGQWKAAGIAVIAEGFADRRYDDAMNLRPRGHVDSMITEPAEATAQALALLARRDGRPMSLCVHSDSTHARAIARQVSWALCSDGWTTAACCSASSGC